jgi:hypothetical protein
MWDLCVCFFYFAWGYNSLWDCFCVFVFIWGYNSLTKLFFFVFLKSPLVLSSWSFKRRVRKFLCFHLHFCHLMFKSSKVLMKGFLHYQLWDFVCSFFPLLSFLEGKRNKELLSWHVLLFCFHLFFLTFYVFKSLRHAQCKL